jgi:hypothetical protein
MLLLWSDMGSSKVPHGELFVEIGKYTFNHNATSTNTFIFTSICTKSLVLDFRNEENKLKRSFKLKLDHSKQSIN